RAVQYHRLDLRPGLRLRRDRRDPEPGYRARPPRRRRRVRALSRQRPAPGTYSVSVEDAGNVVAKRENVAVTIAGGSEVSFAGPAAEQLDAITVTAGAAPAVDVSQVDTRSVFTANDLQRISVARDIASV